MKKFETIYKTIRAFPDVRMNDRSFWRYPDYAQTAITLDNPLHLVLEDEKQQKRFWVSKFGREYSITVANTRYAFDSREYSATQQRFTFKTQRETANSLYALLRMTNEELFGQKAA